MVLWIGKQPGDIHLESKSGDLLECFCICIWQIVLARRLWRGHVSSVKTPRSQSAFTLIELLVVISIIGILASLALPAVNGALDSAKRTQAKNDVVQIATAVTAYETEYGRLPSVPGGKGEVNSALIDILMPTGSGTSTDNPRKIVFLEVPSTKAAGKGKSGQLNGSGSFLDPWGNAYQLAVDDDYDHTIASAGYGSNSVSGLRKKVAVWNEPSEKANRRSVVSWE